MLKRDGSYIYTYLRNFQIHFEFRKQIYKHTDKLNFTYHKKKRSGWGLFGIAFIKETNLHIFNDTHILEFVQKKAQANKIISQIHWSCARTSDEHALMAKKNKPSLSRNTLYVSFCHILWTSPKRERYLFLNI